MKQFEQLRLQPGASVRLSVTASDGKSYNLETVYIGGLALHSLIVATPSAHPQVTWELAVKVAVSIMVATGIATFNARIESVNTTPYGYLHLTYPKLITFLKFRGAARVNVELPAKVAKLNGGEGKNHFCSRILDISVSGLKLATDISIAGVGDELTIHITMHFAGIERSITVQGLIRAHLGGPGEAEIANVYGVKFLPMDDEKKVLLHAFVLNGLQDGSVVSCKDG